MLYIFVVMANCYALADLVSRLAVVVIFWLSVHIFCGHGCCILGRYCIYGWFLLNLCSYAVEIFPTTKNKKDGWCILLLVNVRMDLIWLCFTVIGVMFGGFTLATSGPGCLGCGGGTGGIRARGLEALGSEGNGFGMFWIKIGVS